MKRSFAASVGKINYPRLFFEKSLSKLGKCKSEMKILALWLNYQYKSEDKIQKNKWHLYRRQRSIRLVKVQSHLRSIKRVKEESSQLSRQNLHLLLYLTKVLQFSNCDDLLHDESLGDRLRKNQYRRHFQ